MTKRNTNREAMEHFYSITEAAAIFKVCRLTIVRWIEGGQIEAVKIGRIWRIAEHEISRIKEQRGQ